MDEPFRSHERPSFCRRRIAEKTYTTNAPRFVTLSSRRLRFHPCEPEKYRLKPAPGAGLRHFPDHVTRSRSKLSRGSSISTGTSPCSTVTQRGEAAVASCPAAFSCAYCSLLGSCGEPICFQTENALLWLSSMRYSESRTR